MANRVRVRVRKCKYTRYKGNLYGAGETFKIDEEEWSLSGIGRLVELVPSSKSKKSFKLPSTINKMNNKRKTVSKKVERRKIALR